jgi:hypothetical protein
MKKSSLLVPLVPALSAAVVHALFIGHFFWHHRELSEFIESNSSSSGELLVYFICFFLLSIFTLVMFLLSGLAIHMWLRQQGQESGARDGEAA